MEVDSFPSKKLSSLDNLTFKVVMEPPKHMI